MKIFGMSKLKATKGTSKSSTDIGIAAGQIGGRGRKYYPSNNVWDVRGKTVQESGFESLAKEVQIERMQWRTTRWQEYAS